MKNNLLLKKYDIVLTNGVKSSKEIKSFFGSKLIDIEDEIIIDNRSIQYYEVIDKENIDNDHYQYYDDISLKYESSIIKNLDNIKFKYHSLDIYSQKIPSFTSPNQNFIWIINIDVKNILIEYLFLRLKESRVFKTIKSKDLIERNINSYIINYIIDNILDRYNTSNISFYVDYFDVFNMTNQFTNNQLLYQPNFNRNLYNEKYKVKNINITTPDYLNNLDNVKLIYNQIKDTKKYKFDYYFTISYKKI